jgi:RNA polymerase subunit RPABC4/transcription elongation factor Spt4
MEETMSKDFCMDCGMLLSPHTSVCTVCGYNNEYDDFSDIVLDMDQLFDPSEDLIPENYPGF